MKQVLLRQGQAIVEDVPAPKAHPGTVLVRVDHSCISIGTELSGLKTSALPLWKRAMREPQKVIKAAQMVATQGLRKTWSVIEGKVGAGTATGYSVAGTVLEVGEGVDEFAPGDRVACAGAQYAHHAEFVSVPKNLVVHVPENLAFPEASTVTLGAIALQGVRRAQPTLGETFVVIGLGVLGQITTQLLKANGCKVIGTDLDRARIDTALKHGMDHGIHPDDGNDINQVARMTDGYGADGVIITAASPSDKIVSTAFQMCRKKGRTVLVGDVGLLLNRADFYQKEIDFFISTSYGPGRYDNQYEEKGLDYPISYVRWTENRNLSEYLKLIAEGKLTIAPLISSVYPVEKATEAYDRLKSGGDKPLMVLLHFPAESSPTHTVPNPSWTKTESSEVVKIALIGAGDFAKGMHLPNLQKLNKSFRLQAVMSRTGHNATAIANQFGAAYATTDMERILSDHEVDAVLISTRHHLHASMTLAALQAGKHVLVEKPLALTREELTSIEKFYREKEGQKTPILLTGFNRRFSRYGRFIHRYVSRRSNPMILNYRMNAGHIPLTHWVHSAEGGGRNLGEGCHIYDLFTYLTNSRVVSVQAQCIHPKTNYYSNSDNFVAVVKFEDGSVATLTYTALGAKEHPKEQLEIYVDGKVIQLNDYKLLSAAGASIKEVNTSLPGKGQYEELEAFANSILKGGEWPIPLWQQIQASEIAFQVEDQIRSRT